VVERVLEAGNPRNWRAVVHMGLEDRAKGLKIEVAALNNRASDNTTVYPTAPPILPTTVDLGKLALDPTQATGEIWSRDAGHYYCNEIFYRSLHAVRRAAAAAGVGRNAAARAGAGAGAGPRQLLPVVFVHLPEDTGGNTIAHMADMVTTIIATIMQDDNLRKFDRL